MTCTAEGEAYILLLAAQENQGGGGNERYSPHFIHQQSHTLTQQPSMTNVRLCLRARASELLTFVYL